MAGPDKDHEGLAAEYVLGSLTLAERQQAEQLLATDAAFAALVAAWERRLSPLATMLEPVPVAASLRGKVMAALPPPAAANDNISDLRLSLSHWRSFGIAAAALAAVMVGVLLTRPALPPGFTEGGRYVAVLQTEGPGPAFVASVDLAKGTISVRTVNAEAPAGKSYELWAIGAGRDKPQSLGVIDASYRVPAAVLGKTDSAALGDTLFAVTVEQAGGSPTGQPTGAPVFTGKLIATE